MPYNFRYVKNGYGELKRIEIESYSGSYKKLIYKKEEAINKLKKYYLS